MAKGDAAREFFANYVKGMEKPEGSADDGQLQLDGGFLVPEAVRVPRSGVRAWLLRLFRREEGWEMVDLHKLLLERRERLRWYRK